MSKCKTHKCRASCCYNVPLHDELDKYKDKIVTPVIDTKPVGNAIIPITHRKTFMNRCPFLLPTFRCNIYEHRPEICRLMGEIKDLPCTFRKGGEK